MNLRTQSLYEPETTKIILNTRHPKKENLRPKTISDFKETTSLMNTAPSL